MPPPPIPKEVKNGTGKKRMEEPEYEVIDFGSQNYSNAPPPLPSKPPGRTLILNHKKLKYKHFCVYF